MSKHKSPLSTKSLQKLKNKLPYGAVTQIASILSIDKSVVSKVLNGKVNNQQVVVEALKLIQHNENTLNDLEKEIQSL